MYIKLFEEWIKDTKNLPGSPNYDTFKNLNLFLKTMEGPGSKSVSNKVENFYNEFERLNKNQKFAAQDALKTIAYLKDVNLVINPYYCAMDLRYSQELPSYSYTKKNRPKLTELPVDTVKFCVRWFVQSGLSFDGACALVGNLWRESYLNPYQKQINGGPGRGLAQWTLDDRWITYNSDFFPKFKAGHTMLKNIDKYHIESQLAFVVYELKTEYRDVYNMLITNGNINEKTVTILKKYEIARDKNKAEEQNLRISLALKVREIASADNKIPIIANVVHILKTANLKLFA